MSHSTVSHRWFHQIGNRTTQDNAYSAGNMFYTGKIIYSYGHHFALAIRFDDVVLINSKSYSVSTSKHFGHVQGAIDTSTHKRIYVPFKNARHFDYGVDFKEAYKYIDFQYYVQSFEANLKKLGNARKPEIYTGHIESLQNKLNKVFELWRGSKTVALKTKGIKKLLAFEFTPEIQEKLKAHRAKEIEKQKAKKEAFKKEAFKNLIEYEKGEKSLQGSTLRILDLNTVIRVNGDKIETSKGVKIDLNEGLRVFKLWEGGKALGIDITTKDGHKWNCTKANGIIKFGCHEVNFQQAKRALNGNG